MTNYSLKWQEGYNHFTVLKATPYHDCYHAGFRWIVIDNQLTTIVGCFTCEQNAELFMAALEDHHYGPRNK